MDEYTNIIELARRANFCKIMIQKSSWSDGNWAIVNKIYLKDNLNEEYCKNVIGYIHYKTGKPYAGSISAHNTFNWKTIKILHDDKLDIVYPKLTDK